MTVKSFLRHAKYFGFRFLYYRFVEKFPFFLPRLNDFFSPRLLSSYTVKRLVTFFHGEQGHGADLQNYSSLGLGMIHYASIRMLKPDRVLCIGSLRGYIPAICALACQDNGNGVVDFVDAGFGAETPLSWGGDGFWKKSDLKKHFLKMNLAQMHTYVMTTTEFAKKFPERKYQYIYVDGDHTYEGVKKDYQLFWPKLDKNGLMSFHDILGEGYIGKAKFGVKKFWAEIPDKHKISFFQPVKSGLGMLQK